MGVKLQSPLVVVLCLLWSSRQVRGHGRLMSPPSRSSLWRFPDDPAIAPYNDIVEPNFGDNELFCGGAQHQANLEGKCGVCGDPYDAVKKENEAGGKYAKGIIVRQFSPGSTITVTIEITAHHKGYFEFRLCPWNDPLTPITHDCLNQHVLDVIDGDNKVTKQWFLPSSSGSSSQWYDVQAILPPDVDQCDQCVLQWRYHTGNTWNCGADGECCTGCGYQEEFYGCADIAIGSGPTNPPINHATTMTSTTVTGNEVSTESETSTTKTTTTTASTTVTTESSNVVTTEDSVDSSNPCPSAGAGSHAEDCYKFYQCNGSVKVIYSCPPGTVYDEAKGICDYSYNVSPPCGTKA